jgi:transposase
VTGNTNDANDVAVIAEARSHAAAKYVSVNTQAQQDLQMLHRTRQAPVDEGKAMTCRIRGSAHEYAQIFPVGVDKFRAGLTPRLADTRNGSSAMALETLTGATLNLRIQSVRRGAYSGPGHVAVIPSRDTEWQGHWGLRRRRNRAHTPPGKQGP